MRAKEPYHVLLSRVVGALIAFSLKITIAVLIARTLWR